MKFLLQRLAFYVFTAWAALTINFFIPRLIPGDPVTSLINKFQGQMSTDAINSLYVLFGLDNRFLITTLNGVACYGEDFALDPPSAHGPPDAPTYYRYRLEWGELRFGLRRSDGAVVTVVLDAEH